MEVLAPDRCAPPEGGSALTIGAYDGVHLGHRHLLRELIERAAPRGLSPAVVTFDRHPATVVRPESAPLLLTDLDQKLDLLAACGVERTLVVPFDEDRASESAEDFVMEMLVGRLGARLVVVGEDFHFGHGRKGNVSLLRELGSLHGFDVVGIGLADMVGEPISSTRIRRQVAEGDVEGAALLLGRPHQVRGTVVHGDGRGGSVLGIPTANVAVAPDILLPADGVYAGWYGRPGDPGGRDWGSDHQHLAAISVGRRPTFYDPDHAARLVEAYLLDFDGDLYGEMARVSFVRRLRAEERFESVEALVAQMHRDIDATRAVLAGPEGS